MPLVSALLSVFVSVAVLLSVSWGKKKKLVLGSVYIPATWDMTCETQSYRTCEMQWISLREPFQLTLLK